MLQWDIELNGMPTNKYFWQGKNDEVENDEIVNDLHEKPNHMTFE